MPESQAKPRWYHLSPDRLIFGLLGVGGFLLLSEQFQWFAFNEKKGWTVLIAVAAVCLAVVVMLLWLGASLLFRLRFQFSVRSLVVLVVAVAVPCCWLAMKMRQAERQRTAVEAIREAGGTVFYHYQHTETLGRVPNAEPPAPAWLRKLVGDDFFSNVSIVTLDGANDETLVHLRELTKLVWLDVADTQVTDEGLEHLRELTELEVLGLSDTQVTDLGLEHLTGLTRLTELGLADTQVTDAGLEHLRELTKLEYLGLSSTQVTSQGVEELRKALPNCQIVWEEETAYHHKLQNLPVTETDPTPR